MGIESKRMSNLGFHLMTWTYRLVDFFVPGMTDKLEEFGIKKGDIVVDYGCGPGRYVKKASELVGKEGLVYAADIHSLAIEKVKKLIRRNQLTNVEPVLINGYDSGLDDNSADVIYALDMFHHVARPEKFFSELSRIIKQNGTLFLEDGHQSRKDTLKKLERSNLWSLEKEKNSYIICRPNK